MKYGEDWPVIKKQETRHGFSVALMGADHFEYYDILGTKAPDYFQTKFSVGFLKKMSEKELTEYERLIRELWNEVKA